MNEQDPSQVVRWECEISVDHLCKWALRVVERWVLSATPCQPKERKKYHGAIRNVIAASSHVLSLSPEGVPSGYIALG